MESSAEGKRLAGAFSMSLPHLPLNICQVAPQSGSFRCDVLLKILMFGASMLEFHGMKLLWLSGSVVMNRYFWVVGPGGVVFLGCQMEGSKINLLSIDGMIGKGQANLPKRSKMLHWNPFQAQDFQDVKGSLAMSCLGSLLHKDPIRTQPG